MGLFSRKVNEVVPADPRMKLTKPALIEEIDGSRRRTAC
jgi:hypothetical protein